MGQSGRQGARYKIRTLFLGFGRLIFYRGDNYRPVVLEGIKMQINQYYPLADRPRVEDLEPILDKIKARPGLVPNIDINDILETWRNPFVSGRTSVVAVRTTELRCPKTDEWYLPGDVPEGYRALSDMSSTHDILQLTIVSTKLIAEAV